MEKFGYLRVSTGWFPLPHLRMRCLLLGPCPLLSKTMSPIPLTPGPWPCTCRRAPTLVVDSAGGGQGWGEPPEHTPWKELMSGHAGAFSYSSVVSYILHDFRENAEDSGFFPNMRISHPLLTHFMGREKKNKTKAPTLAPEIIPRPSDVIYLWKIKNSPKLVQLSSICRTNRKWSSKLKIRLPIESGIRKNEDSKFDRATQLQRNPTSAPKTHKPRSPFLNLDRPPGTSEAPQTCKDRRTTGRNKENNQPQM